MQTVQCNQCQWQGEEDDLLRMAREDGGVFYACPFCETDDYLMDLDPR